MEDRVLCHPLIIGELACGNLKDRRENISLLLSLPEAHSAEEGEVLRMIEDEKLYGLGIGIVDAHVLASAQLSEAQLWTRDIPLQKAARELEIFFRP